MVMAAPSAVSQQAPPSVDVVAPHLKFQPPARFPDMSDNYQKTVTIPAQQAAEQAQEAQAVQATPPPAPAPQTASYGATGGCADWMTQAGITDPTALLVVMRESGCNPNAVNSSSGACGIGQQLPCGKWPHAWNDPVGALIDTQAYVYGTYGSWEDAWAHEQNYSWY